jgi:2-oxoglutarate dehydrogenase E2 component (dihydrolipoamide succinyltransferase)
MSLIEMRVPPVGESINEVTLSRWLKAEGSYVKLDEPICEFESDKATLEFPAEAAGKLIYVANEGDDLAIGALVATIDTDFAKDTVTTAPPSPVSLNPEPDVKPSAPPNTYAAGHPSPAASKILEEKGISLQSVQGSGKDGRITKSDAMQAVAPVSSELHNVEKIASMAGFSRTVERKKMSRMRRTIAKRLVSAKNETAMLTTFNEVDLSAVMQLRDKYQDKFVAKFGIKLGFMSIFAKACAKVLMEMPEINARIDGEDLVLPQFVDISFAISTPNGLVVPPIKNIESLSFAEIEIALKDLAQKARNGSLTLDEMSGGTFTITNGGVFGSLLSTPIINEPQSAILGMHSIKNRPVAIDGKVEIRPMMYLAMSYDHRVIDGSSSVTFLVKVKELLEDPMLLFMGL